MRGGEPQLRPVRDGPEWEAEPREVRLADPLERLRAETARRNAVSREGLL
ncbi:hypothetical protein [Streptomyces sp. NPDC059564]